MVLRRLKKLLAAEDSALLGCWRLLSIHEPYNLYLLTILLGCYLLAQINQYVLAVVARPMAQEIGFGERMYANNQTESSYTNNCTFTAPPMEASLETQSLANILGEVSEAALTVGPARSNDSSAPASLPGCEQPLYQPAGYQYNVLIGPAFFLFFTGTGIPLGIVADVYSRKVILGICLLLWSACTTCTGFVTTYWQLLLLRIGVAVGQSVCVPLCTSLIADHFSQKTRGAALGFFSLGTNAGYSLAFTLGDLITRANFYGKGWRMAFILTGLPGILHSFIISFTVTEPAKVAKKRRFKATSFTRQNLWANVCRVLRPFASPTLLSLTVASSVRLTVGIMWAYNVQLYFEAVGQSAAAIAGWLSWIPLAAGSLGAVLGGVFSDVLHARLGLAGRLWVLVLSQLATAPCAAAALYLRPPHAFYLLVPCLCARRDVHLGERRRGGTGEMFISASAAAVVELVPADLRSSTVAVFAFITTNVGGSLQLLLGPIVAAFKASGASHEHAFRMGLYLLFPGGFALSGLLFVVALHHQQTSTSTLYGDRDGPVPNAV
ncbi:MFS-type efflux pump MSMEG_3705-like [Pollicipes pollicipes]|uniref:MFS-type efflux pump MSMEG_3705-like n=1 Tax=Pollicipes pollicipes TaxID=41117 RepID=UPI00188507CB|nr:MFS-type efflux pump MSMEG_3705-like [Pollicipes pollicipes]